MRTKDDARLENHKDFIDILIPPSRAEQFGNKPKDKRKHPIGEYDSANDVLYLNEAIEQIENVEKGKMIVFYTDTALVPLIGEGRIRKAFIN